MTDFAYNPNYRKIPKISPGAYIFQRPFLRGLFLDGLIFGGAYLRIASHAGVFRGARFLRDEKRLRGRLIYGGKFAFQNRLGQRYRWKEIYSFCFVLLCICLRAISRFKPPGSLYLEGRFNGGSFALRV